MGPKQVLFVFIAIIFAIVYVWFVFGESENPFVFFKEPDRVPVMAKYRGKLSYLKVVYTTNTNQATARFENDCRLRKGRFNMCGNTCDLNAQTCTQVCAFTCEVIK
ncbi:MAG: hypothetical protein L6Q29_01960 [Candidatus Pacebacteria bacterium]|nr:hypothetical protein [Candidatus Paceibacterota bacterium]NUQ56950.1 hypothetical protein [Candidatus Paceibacter sp.]